MGHHADHGPKAAIIPILFLALVELVSFGLFSPRMGFYHDDWYLLELASRGGDFWGAARVFAESDLCTTRPVEILLYPLLYALGGLRPFSYQAALVALDLSQGLFFFYLLKRLTGSPRLALTAAALALMCPNRAVTHVWFANASQGLALVLVLASLLLHLRWLAARGLPEPGVVGSGVPPPLTTGSGRLPLLIGQACYLLSILSYESAAFMPLMLAGGLVARDPRGVKKIARDMLPYVLTLAAALSWQWFGAPLLAQAENPKTVGFSVGHFLKAYGAGFECLTNRVIHVCWKAAGRAFEEIGLGLAPLWAGFTAAAALTLARQEEAALEWRAFMIAGGAILGGFLGAYAPYALSSSYVPQVHGLMSRTNGGGALVAGLSFAVLAGTVDSGRRRGLVLALLIGAFTWTNWHTAFQWAKSWETQRDILGKLGAKARHLPPEAAVVLANSPGYIDGAVVFDASWDFGPALRLTTGRSDLAGHVSSPDREPPELNSFEYDYGRDTIRPLPPAKARAP